MHVHSGMLLGHRAHRFHVQVGLSLFEVAACRSPNGMRLPCSRMSVFILHLSLLLLGFGCACPHELGVSCLVPRLLVLVPCNNLLFRNVGHGVLLGENARLEPEQLANQAAWRRARRLSNNTVGTDCLAKKSRDDFGEF